MPGRTEEVRTYVTDDFKDRLQDVAEANLLSISELVRQAVVTEVNRLDGESKT